MAIFDWGAMEAFLPCANMPAIKNINAYYPANHPSVKLLKTAMPDMLTAHLIIRNLSLKNPKAEIEVDYRGLLPQNLSPEDNRPAEAIVRLIKRYFGQLTSKVMEENWLNFHDRKLRNFWLPLTRVV